MAFIESNAQALPEETFPSDTYDLYTIAFGIRNCTSIPDVLKEAHRVLKPGGTFSCLEFSKVNNPILSLYACVSFTCAAQADSVLGLMTNTHFL